MEKNMTLNLFDDNKVTLEKQKLIWKVMGLSSDNEAKSTEETSVEEFEEGIETDDIGYEHPTKLL